MKYNPDTHHRKSIRLKEYDYSQAGYYFITICTYNKQHLFGKIHDGTVILNECGEIVDDCLKNLSVHFPNIKVDYYCIMPNHIHVIIINDECRGTACRALSESFGNPSKGSLPTIIRATKSAISKAINELINTPGNTIWQRNYYEHIIRNEKELFEIRKYIELNPMNWNKDEYFE